jgi:outer membrane protein assembly factor BamB
MLFDRTFQMVAAGGVAYFGSSVDGKVTALDVESAAVKWEFYTEGPIRMAPAVWKGKVYVGGDDGYLYCLDASSGKLLWKLQAAPGDDLVLGNEKMISKWPIRGGLAIKDGVVYFVAGIWPTEQVLLYAVDANTGKLKWKNDQSGSLKIDQPHNATAESGVAGQGYLVVTDKHIIVPTGRAVPACFDRETGAYKYFHLARHGKRGGGRTVGVGEYFMHDRMLFDAKTGAQCSGYSGNLTVVTPEGVATAGSSSLSYSTMSLQTRKDRRGRQSTSMGLSRQWGVEFAGVKDSLIAAGDKIIGGGDGVIKICDMTSQKVVWETKQVKGRICGLLYSNGALLASSDAGILYCFSAAEAPVKRLEPKTVVQFDHMAQANKLASEIVEKSKMTKGYCLDLGCGDGSLAYALTQKTDLYIVAVESDEKLVAKARRQLDKAGVYGARVIVLHRDLKSTDLPNYFANLIVSQKQMLAGKELNSPEALRCQSPYGGVLCSRGVEKISCRERGGLKGAGSWTHQYADSSNSLCSDDALVKGKLTVLWYRDVDIANSNRHYRGPSPLSVKGLLIHMGSNEIVALNAYNGHEVWRTKAEGLLDYLNGFGVSVTGGMCCVGDDKIFVRHHQKCLVIDLFTGKIESELAVPGEKGGHWGYLAYSDGLLYGSSGDKDKAMVGYRKYDKVVKDVYTLSESKSLFAYDLAAKKMVWQVKADKSFRHNAIAIDGKNVYVIDREFAGHKMVSRRQPKKPDASHALGVLKAFDKKTGKLAWKNEKDIFGTVLVAADGHQSLVMGYQHTYLKLDSELRDKLAVFDTDSGRLRWSNKSSARSRAVIHKDKVIHGNLIWDLKSGASVKCRFSQGYGCGNTSASRDMILFRSGTVGYVDLVKDRDKVQYFGGVRSGCFINIIPAGGIVLAPDFTDPCSCSYLNKTWFALQPLVNTNSYTRVELK